MTYTSNDNILDICDYIRYLVSHTVSPISCLFCVFQLLFLVCLPENLKLHMWLASHLKKKKKPSALETEFWSYSHPSGLLPLSNTTWSWFVEAVSCVARLFMNVWISCLSLSSTESHFCVIHHTWPLIFHFISVRQPKDNDVHGAWSWGFIGRTEEKQ